VSWKDGVWQFSGESLQDIARRLSRYYRVNICCDASVASVQCSGKLYLFDDIHQVLQVLSNIFNVNYRITPKGIIIRKTL
jgi:ferric-dicitrate binding protein FerR (iron transport regulator)